MAEVSNIFLTLESEVIPTVFLWFLKKLCKFFENQLVLYDSSGVDLFLGSLLIAFNLGTSITSSFHVEITLGLTPVFAKLGYFTGGSHILQINGSTFLGSLERGKSSILS